jgi:hypothetical protein
MTNLLALNDLSVQSGTNPAYLALLAAIFITLLGGMMMPAFVAMARTSVANRLTRAAVWAAFKSALARWVQVAIAVLTSSAALVLVIAVIGATPAAAQKSPMASTAAAAPQLTAPIMFKHTVFGPAAKCATNPVCRTAAQEALKRLANRVLERAGDTVDNLIDLIFDATRQPNARDLPRLIDALETELGRHGRLDAGAKADLAILRQGSSR